MDAPAFALTETHRQFRTTLRRFAEDRIAPNAAEADREASGECQASYCLSEADAGSDVAAMRTRAVRDGGDYLLSGTKYWVTNAGISDTYTVFAVTDPDAGRQI